MQHVVTEQAQTPPRGGVEPGARPRCALCGKPLDEDVVRSWPRNGPLCFWCAYVEPQG